MSLLSLPLELRELIIELALFTSQPPLAPSKCNRSDLNDIKYRAWRHRTYYEQSPVSCPSLLLVNRHLAVETQSILTRQPTQYILNIAIVNEVDLFPTWVSVPRLNTRISTLYADIQLHGHILSKPDARAQVGCGGHLGFQWSFYALLERFLQYGPLGDQGPDPSCPRDITIDTLILDFSSAETSLPAPPAEVDYRRWWRRQHFLDRGRRSEQTEDVLVQYRARPEWMAEYLAKEMTGLLNMGYYHAKYGMILYEQIGRIQILVEGQLVKAMDLGKSLKELHFHDAQETLGHLWPRELRVPAFKEWLRKTKKRRTDDWMIDI
ncbi:hypothetical protein ASPZODRAFT_168231 [Penicilliopsis zonata CBS 506.65]|uniref:F-box domain-containing protein n=1 Tax=Penicilliopsis zonata CBS 506.65 TaxID=1073090 RepID=A0A1L9SDA6_9EURO|nr:hypothetical protein ASPZODRAFT_168231 [Penicilliopsis zonata CBS 506.65]OJJ45176.1 hypothetical protein ASPZODRAFT_168231 [Penicilliopsis zonata CBS 506.65]